MVEYTQSLEMATLADKVAIAWFKLLPLLILEVTLRGNASHCPADEIQHCARRSNISRQS